MIFGWGFPGVLPKATLTMAVGQMWGGGCVCSRAEAQATLGMAVGQ